MNDDAGETNSREEEDRDSEVVVHSDIEAEQDLEPNGNNGVERILHMEEEQYAKGNAIEFRRSSSTETRTAMAWHKQRSKKPGEESSGNVEGSVTLNVNANWSSKRQET